MATTKAVQGRQELKRRPIFSRTFFPVQVAVFEHTGENERKNYSVKVTRTFRRTEESEWETSEYLGVADLLPAAQLLTAAYEAIQDRLEQTHRERQEANQEVAY